MFLETFTLLKHTWKSKHFQFSDHWSNFAINNRHAKIPLRKYTSDMMLK